MKANFPRLSLGIFCLLLSLTFCGDLTFPGVARSEISFGYADAVKEASTLSEKPFEEPQKLPESLQKITYDQWRNIRFKPEESLWRADHLPFEVQFFHPGWLYDRKVSIYEIDPDGVKPVVFSPEMFHYGMNQFKDQIPPDVGFAGFRVHYPINTKDYYDEVIVFLGATYFRAVGANQVYGLSARGVAINTAMEGGEEFPYFKKFWLERPTGTSEDLTIYALMDSPSLTGACKFVVHPGNQTLVDVSLTLFLRKEIKKLGIAALNSMFFYGENTNIRPVNDFRPEVHDSDGLQLATDTGEWIWRPLVNPKNLLVTSFQMNNPKGFGLFQRDLDFDHYQDLEAFYQKRPSAWVVPQGNWGEGRVELVQIPTDTEINDNIVSYWVPAVVPKPGVPIAYSYQMKWGFPEMAEPPAARAVATRIHVGKEEDLKTYLVDFAGEKLRAIKNDSDMKADISVGGGEVIEQHLQENPYRGGWRFVFQVKKKKSALDRVTPGADDPLELRAFLRNGEAILTETWSYVDPF